MNNPIKIILSLIIGFIIGISLTSIIHIKNGSGINKNIPDTIFIDKPYQVLVPYKDTTNPKIVTIYKTVPKAVFVKDSLYNVPKVVMGKDTIIFNDNFLLAHPYSDKLIQLISSKNKLSLTTIDHNGITMSRDFEVNYDNYTYNYYNSIMTVKRNKFFKGIHFKAEYSFRPLNNFHDLKAIGLYDCNKYMYIGLGVSFSYYPKSYFVDPILSIGFNLF